MQLVGEELACLFFAFFMKIDGGHAYSTWGDPWLKGPINKQY